MISYKEKNNEIEVTAVLEERSFPKTEIRTSDILKFLKKEGIDFADILEESHVHNHSSDRLVGKWLFSKGKSDKKVTTKESKKSLTKSPKSAKVKGKSRKDA